LLFHAWDGLRARQKTLEVNTAQNESLINDINAVSDFIGEHFGDSIGNLNSLSKHGEITYPLVWALFPPNSLVFTVSNTLQQPQVFIFMEGSYEETSQGEKYYSITGRIINHDGINFGYGEIDLKISEFVGARKLQSLAVFPLSAHPDEAMIREQLIERGRRFTQVVKPVCQEYIGMSVRQEQNPNGRMKETLSEVYTLIRHNRAQN
jgi:Domain of unknown function (DUF7025)